MAPYFQYELTAISNLLFKDCGVFETAKECLAKFLYTSEHDVWFWERNVQIYHVLNGGAFHRMKWPKKVKHWDIVKVYVQYVHQNYGHM